MNLRTGFKFTILVFLILSLFFNYRGKNNHCVLKASLYNGEIDVLLRQYQKVRDLGMTLVLGTNTITFSGEYRNINPLKLKGVLHFEYSVQGNSSWQIEKGLRRLLFDDVSKMGCDVFWTDLDEEVTTIPKTTSTIGCSFDLFHFRMGNRRVGEDKIWSYGAYIKRGDLNKFDGESWRHFKGTRMYCGVHCSSCFDSSLSLHKKLLEFSHHNEISVDTRFKLINEFLRVNNLPEINCLNISRSLNAEVRLLSDHYCMRNGINVGLMIEQKIPKKEYWSNGAWDRVYMQEYIKKVTWGKEYNVCCEWEKLYCDSIKHSEFKNIAFFPGECSYHDKYFRMDLTVGCNLTKVCDIVIATQVLEHINKPEIAMENLRKIGKELIITVPTYSPVHGIPMDYLRYTKDMIMSLNSNCVVEEVKNPIVTGLTALGFGPTDFDLPENKAIIGYNKTNLMSKYYDCFMVMAKC